MMRFRPHHSVIPTGEDHREGDDLRSGEPALSEVEGDLVFSVCNEMLLLYKRADCGATKEELEKWLRPSQRKNLLRTLHQLEHDKDLIVLVNGRYQITRRGIQEAECKKLLEVE